MLNIAFCDDDENYLSHIAKKTEKIYKYLKTNISINTFSDGAALIESFKKYQSYYNIIFLDIDMPNINGKDTARILRTMDKKFKLVFITDYENEALNTFQYDVIGFLPKALIDSRLPDLIERMNQVIEEDDPQVQLFRVEKNTNGVMDIRIPLNDIMYFESINRKVYLTTQRGTFILYRSQFSEIVERYLSLGFVDIHRTCIVNMKYIFSVDNNEIRLDNGTRLPISRRKKQKIFDQFSKDICGEI